MFLLIFSFIFFISSFTFSDIDLSKPHLDGGKTHTIALKEDGTVWTWGDNETGELGNGTFYSSDTPVQVVGPNGEGFLTDIIAIAGGGAHTIALKEDGTVWAWGNNYSGALGNGNNENSNTPVQVVGPNGEGFLTNIIAITAGYTYTVALKKDGTVWTWGSNYDGQLGNGTFDSSNTPVQVIGPDGEDFLTDIIAIAAGDSHTLALKDDGTVWAWGDNFLGQLGNGTSVPSNTPVQVVGPDGIGTLTNIIAIGAGGCHSIALKDDGTVWAWGDNFLGQLGNGTSVPSNTPVQVVGPDGIGTLTNIIAIAAGGSHTLALRNDGTVWAWGRNYDGQLGNENNENSNTPVQVVGPNGEGFLTNIIAIAAGGFHSIALKDDGTVWAWGNNFNGQLGNGSSNNASNIPVKVIYNGNPFSLYITLGDINDDGEIDISDVILCLRMAIGLDPGNLTLADMNNDGTVDISDVILVLRKAIGLD